MITAVRTGGTLEAGTFDFTGKSTDDKPTESWEGTQILNTSTFFEMDTLKVKFYDQSTDDWLPKEV